MIARLRALASLVMLAGFFIFALALLVAGVGVGIWALGHSHYGVKLMLLAVLGFGGAIVVGAKRALFYKAPPAEGVAIDPHRAPELWAEVRRLADAAGTRAPDEIRVVHEVNAAVSENSQLLGLIGGKRYLYIGMPLLVTLNVSQFRAVIGHELGHYSNNHTRLGAVAFRGRLAIGGALDHLSGSLMGLPFQAYGRIYLLVDNAASRAQEREADLIAVRVAGTHAAASALAELPVIDAAWAFYFNRYIGPAAQAGFLPRDMFRGFHDMTQARREELAELRKAPPPEKKSVWDTHPPIGERVARVRQLPPVTLMEDTRLAGALIPALDQLGEQVQTVAVNLGDRKLSGDWSEITQASNTAQLQDTCDDVFRQAARVLNVRNVSLADVLYAVEAGRGRELAQGFFPAEADPVGKLPQVIEPLLTLAALRSGQVRWTHSWTQRAQLAGPNGQPVDFEELAKLAADARTVGQARAHLAQLGIAVDQARVVEAVATAKKAEVIGGIGNTKVGKTDCDMLILDNGLILIPGGGDSNEGNYRMAAALRSAPVPELAKRYTFVPFEEIAVATIDKKVPLKATLLMRNGEKLELKEGWTSDLLHKQSRDVLLEILEGVRPR
ncbi:MAG: M48 family metalloprotease [Hamadaea sp.]|uniref:M48 family metallopeptidase n=1 Tax=Hamadaea sp. TaxID=2024425 RepID=UPI001828101E|nr:M48 family metallopeptidase [Hamadaea sp.]NUT23567.1 M48 family metalloprotease [Hamadaea sp.]